MELLDSDWLQRMAEKSGRTPQLRMLALFDILQDWAVAPGMREQLLAWQPALDEGRALRLFLSRLAREAGARQPEVLASQLGSMLLGALREQLRVPEQAALAHARVAAALLVDSQTRRQVLFPAEKAASLASLAVGTLLALFVLDRPAESIAPAPARLAQAAPVLNPDQVASLYRLHDRIQAGTCHYPQALMLPPEQRAVYLENVVEGQGGAVMPANLPMVQQLYQKVDCYYPPAAMLL